MSLIERIDWIIYIISMLSHAALSALCFRTARAQKNDGLSFYLLSGFYVCVCLSSAYYLLVWTVAEYPFVLSPGDLSWVGGLLFLITAAQELAGRQTSEQRLSTRKYRLPALLAPVVCLAFNIAYITIYSEIIFNYVLYGIPTLILSYYALWLLLAAQAGAFQPCMRTYHLTVLIWLAIQLLYDLFSTLGYDYGFAIPYTICSCLLMLASNSIYFAARKGAAA